MTRDEFRQIATNGVWKQNTSIVQILGLCPLLAVTTNVVNGAMLSLATIIVMAVSGLAIASLRNLIPHEIRIPVFILVVAALVTVVDLLFNANLHELYPVSYTHLDVYKRQVHMSCNPLKCTGSHAPRTSAKRRNTIFSTVLNVAAAATSARHTSH